MLARVKAGIFSSDEEVGGRGGRPRGMEAGKEGGVGFGAEGMGLWVLGDGGGVVI